jgi:hypothetical protein
MATTRFARIKRYIEVAEGLVSTLPENIRGHAFAEVFRLISDVDSNGPPVRRKKSSRRYLPLAVPNPGNGSGSERQKPRAKSGPKDWTGDLIEAGFFVGSRTAADVAKELKEKHGRNARVSDIAKALLRLLHEGRLKRTSSEERGYEYIAN